ncbi:Mus7/MMS22 family-domain-containing protein [Mycena belliarum]|uniref:Mus7/MMS22 family-domain-containing protein n=1 Tax=Mycena belliarum TaxID=1033014 RepID=A0AAD6TQ70_9AGAR|nr:Mus7/MMS22 family-domain-containing protein [Mycena belliae]
MSAPGTFTSPHLVLHFAKDPSSADFQDPLLFSDIVGSDIKPPPYETRSSSPHLDRILPASPMIVKTDNQVTPLRSRSESVDPLLLFSHSRPTIHDEPTPIFAPSDHADSPACGPKSIPSSPLTPVTPPTTVSRNISPRRSASPVTTAKDFDIAQALDDDQQRYSLRARQAKQIHPYRHDRAQYKNTLRNVPEAIVKFRSPRRHHTRGEDYEVLQTQEADGYEAENDNWEEQRSPRRRSRSKSEQRPVHGVNLPSLPSTDEEEGEAIDAMRKEGRKLRREQKNRETTGTRARKKARPFPLLDPTNPDHGLQSASHRVDSHSNSPHTMQQRSRSHRPSSSTISPVVFRASTRPRSRTPMSQHARSVSPSLSFHDHNYSDTEIHIVSPSSQTRPKDPGTPIVISDEDDVELSGPQRQSDDTLSELEPSSKEEKKQRRKIRALNRIYPAFMRERMMKDPAPAKRSSKRQRSATISSESDEGHPLLPGQTRVRIAQHPYNLRDVKGDSESSDSQTLEVRDAEDDEPAASDSDVEVVWHRQRRWARDASLQSSSDEDVLSDGRIDDERIEAYLKEAPIRGSGLKEKDMIDWMLANTAQVGGTKRANATVKSRKSSYPEGPRRPRISVTVGGARRHRQTLLSFDKPSDRGRSRSRRPARNNPSSGTAAPPPREDHERDPAHHRLTGPSRGRHQRDTSPQDVYAAYAPSFDLDNSPQLTPPFANRRQENVQQIPHPDIQRKAARRQKEKENKARRKMQGIHVLVAPKGRRIAKTVNIDVADPGFQQVLAPHHRRPRPALLPNPQIVHAKPRPPEHPIDNPRRRLLPRGDRPHWTAATRADVEEIGEESEEPSNPPDAEARSLSLDFGICNPGSALSFGLRTYIQKGRLNEILNPHEKPPAPNIHSAHGFDLGPNVTAHEFIIIFEKLCDRLLETAIGLPQYDGNEDEANGWTELLGASCRLLTSLLVAGEEAQTLKDVVETHILRLTSKMREASLTYKSIDSTTFTICWFAVEISVRSDFRLPPCAPKRSLKPNVLQQACAVLIEHLLEYGLDRGMSALISGPHLVDGSTTEHRALEAWVGIWHIMNKYRDPAPLSVNPLWTIVQSALEAQTAGMSDLDASEHIWRAIISLSAISQVSPGPGATGFHSSPASWDIVVFALQRIRLEAYEVDDLVSESSLDAHDLYVKLVVERCCTLWSRWQWPTDHAFGVLNLLTGIFRSRKFANLRHEKAEFPDFLRVNDWTLLSRPIHSESAFVLFLKLVYQTLIVDQSKVKKLLSLATPVGSLSWSKTQPPSMHDLSMLFNRFSVIAIAIHIDPIQHARWILQSRRYVRFKDADPTTRNAHIRGWMYLTIVAVQCNRPLQAALDWLEEMVDAMLEEHKSQTGSIVELGLHALVVSVRNVIRAYKSDKPPHRYPDPQLLLAVERILRDPSLVKPTNASAHMVPRLIRSFLAVRAAAVPPPQRPPLPPIEESQDEYGDLTIDQDMLGVLDEREIGQYRDNDRSLCKLLENISWTLFRQLVQYFKFEGVKASFKANDRRSTDIASLTACWLGCGNIIIQDSLNQSGGKKTWSTFMHAYNNQKSWPRQDTFSDRRMEFLVHSNILKLDPMCYSTFQDKFIEVFFESLTSWHTTSEHEYIGLLLSIDGLQHPLFRGVLWDPNVQKEDGELSRTDLLTARLPLFAVILSNLNQCLTEGVHEDNRKYVGYCIAMFSAMKNVHGELQGTAKSAYAAWCLQAYQVYQNHPDTLTDPRLGTMVAWFESLRYVGH